MLISVFTPTHDATYLKETYKSLKKQTYLNWEWIIVPNGNVKINLDDFPESDLRIKIIPYTGTNYNIGALKKFACEHCKGELFVELDHDDMLTPDALETISSHYIKLGTDNAFLYSDTVHFYNGMLGKSQVYNSIYGWESYPFFYDGLEYTALRSFDPTPCSLRHVNFAPDHVRVWSKKAYEVSGGHSPETKLGDDHELICKSYIAGVNFHHIPQCLYMYRVHEKNSCMLDNDGVMKQVNENQRKYLYPLISRWCEINELPKLDMGAAHNKKPGFLGVDMYNVPGVDVVCNALEGLPYKDNSIGCISCTDFLEHMPLGSLPKVFNEFYRVLVPGGWLISDTPSTDGRGAFQDPTHSSFINSNSFWYYTNRDYAKFVPEIKCRFQMAQIWNSTPNDFCKLHNIVYVHADMVAIKDQRLPGECLI